MNKFELDTLIKTGFRYEEAIIYLTLIGRKKMSITEISHETKIKRPTCYEYIDDMLEKDYIYRTPVGKKFHYVATNPEKLLVTIKNNLRNLDTVFTEIGIKHNNANSRPKISFFEGKSSIKSIYRESFETVGDALSIFPADEYFKEFDFEEFIENEKTIKSTKFRSKDLIIDGKSYRKVHDFLKVLKNENKLVKKLPKDFNTSVDVLVYGSKVALISLKNASALVIDNQEIAQLFTSIHKYLWKSTK